MKTISVFAVAALCALGTLSTMIFAQKKPENSAIGTQEVFSKMIADQEHPLTAGMQITPEIGKPLPLPEEPRPSASHETAPASMLQDLVSEKKQRPSGSPAAVAKPAPIPREPEPR